MPKKYHAEEGYVPYRRDGLEESYANKFLKINARNKGILEMKEKLFLLLVLIIIIIIGLFYFKLVDPYYFRRIEGNKLILKIKEYRDKNNRYPDTLEDIGIVESEEGPFHYEKKSETEYIIWFGTFLGESETYYSKKKKWGY